MTIHDDNGLTIQVGAMDELCLHFSTVHNQPEKRTCLLRSLTILITILITIATIVTILITIAIVVKIVTIVHHHETSLSPSTTITSS